MRKITFSQTKNIYDYSPLLDNLFDDFGYAFYDTILELCGILKDRTDGTYEQIYVVKLGKKVIGICGLYSYFHNTKELWLGYFGLLPEYRNKKIGGQILAFSESEAKKVGCKKILAFVYKEGTPLSFYYRHGYKKIGTVKTYLKSHPKMDRDYFEHLSDIIIEKEILN